MPGSSKFVMALWLMGGGGSLGCANPLAAFAAGLGQSSPPAAQATLIAAAATSPNPSPDIPVGDYDSQAERQLLDLTNQARSLVGAAPLTLDPGLTQAARAHAAAMSTAGGLSHQLPGEPSLARRLMSASLQLEREGENVALDYAAPQGHEHLMLSPPHRANLLNPAYNVVGMAAVRSGDLLYIVQDFGQALPGYSAAQVKEKIASAIERERRLAKRPALARRDPLPPEAAALDDAACSMAQADTLRTSPIHLLARRSTVLSYTSLHPESLPENAGPALANPNLRRFSVGTCHAATETYPTGAYWVVVTLE
jgi:uncharacterized protein YkwD